jgi:hypothetical protein
MSKAPQMESDRAVLRLVALLENAPRVPLLRGRVRVDKREVLKLADSIDEPPTSQWADTSSATSGVTTAIAAVRDAVRSAYPIPFTDQVRLPVEHVAELAAKLRSCAED